MKTQKYNKTILNYVKPELVAKQNKKTILESILLIALGLILICSAVTLVADSSSTLYMSILTLGIIVAVFGIVKLSNRNPVYYYAKTDSAVESFSVYYDPKEREKLVRAIEQEDGAAFKNFAMAEESNIRLDFIVSKDGKFAACQLYEYIPYSYEPASTVHSMDGTSLAVIAQN